MLATKLATEIEVRHNADLEKRGAERWPSRTNTASQLGHPCARRMYYKRMAWKEARPFGPQAIGRMDAGNVWEAATLRRLDDLGFEVEETQVLLDWPEYQIAGKQDVLLRDRKLKRSGVPAEIKSLARWGYEQIGSVADMLASRSIYYRLYPHQLNLYMVLRDCSSGLFILRNREDGALKTIAMEVSFELAQQCLNRAVVVNEAVASGVAPPVIEWCDWCESCDFRTYCRHPELRAEPLDVITDDGVLGMLRERDELTAARSRYEKLDRAIKKYLAGKVEGTVVCGEYQIVAKHRTRKGYTVEPSEYMQYDIRRWKENDDG